MSSAKVSAKTQTSFAVVAAVLIWWGWLLLSSALFVVGLVLIAIALSRGWVVTIESPIVPHREIAAWSKWWMWLFGNDEDGLCPCWYVRAHLPWSITRCRYVWSALRNSVNNLERVRYLNLTLEPARLVVVQGKLGYWCRQGIYAGGQLQIGKSKQNFGYGLIPFMTRGMPENDTRDLPFISQHWTLLTAFIALLPLLAALTVLIWRLIK